MPRIVFTSFMLVALLGALASMSGCGTTREDWATAAGAMGAELSRQAQTGSGVFTQPQIPVQSRVTPYKCTSRQGSGGVVTTECR